MVHLRLLDPEGWREMCRDFLVPTPYHDPRWLELIGTVYPRMAVHRLGCFAGPGECQWLLPLVQIHPLGRWGPMLVSLPFGNYGGFLFPDHKKEDFFSKEGLEPFFSAFEAGPCGILEIRSPVQEGMGFKVEEYYRAFLVDIPATVDLMWSSISGNARTSIRKAGRLGVDAFVAGETGLAAFQSLYEKNASFHGTPVHAQSWYGTLSALFREEAEIILARHHGRVIGALLLLHFGNRTILHAAVTDPGYRHIPATDRMIWEALTGLVHSGRASRFDFGRTRPEKGTLFFKRKWGGREKPMPYVYLLKEGRSIPRVVPENASYGLAVRVWQKIPMFLQRRLGPYIRPRIPA
jgi:FemAB-related protein (PEP-CTERM system-associated)